MSHTLSKTEKEVIEIVLRIHPNAKPPGIKTQWPECIQREPDGSATFWYNVNNNTYMVHFLENDDRLVKLIGGMPAMGN